jgi:hypothetical protein
MDRLKELLNIWTGLGIVAGVMLVPKVLSGLGQQGWNPNWGYWRPIGNYGIGAAFAAKELNPLHTYQGGMRQLGVELNPLRTYSGGPVLGQAYRSGESLLPFGFEGEYKPSWMYAPTARDIM